MSELIRAWLLQPVLDYLLKLTKAIEMNQAEIVERLDTVEEIVGKIGEETLALTGEVADLKAAVTAAGNVTPELEAAMSAVEARVKSVDDLVADVPPVEPV